MAKKTTTTTTERKNSQGQVIETQTVTVVEETEEKLGSLYPNNYRPWEYRLHFLNLASPDWRNLTAYL